MAGGVYKRGKAWQAVIRSCGHETICNTFDTEKEASSWYYKTKSEMKAGTFVSRKEADSTTLLEDIDRYEREILHEKKYKTGRLSSPELEAMASGCPIPNRHSFKRCSRIS